MAGQLGTHERQAVPLERSRNLTATVVLALVSIHDARRLACTGEYPYHGAAAWAQADAMLPVAKLVRHGMCSRQHGSVAVQPPTVVIVLGQLAENE